MSKRKWETQLHEARELRKRGSELLFDRVALLVSVYNDGSFRSWCAANETVDLDYLDEELSDTAASFMTLKAVLVEHPTRDEWVKHNIRDLIAQVIESQAESRKRDGEPKRPSWKERAMVAERECERLRAEIASIKESLGIVAGARGAA